MKRNKLIIATIVVLSGIIHSCIKHEIIPAPEKKADLSCHFLGTINGTPVEITQDVNAYTCVPTQAKTILPSPSPSSATYYADIASTTNNVSIKVALGSATWDNGVTSVISLASFNAFFTSNLSPANPTYQPGALNGFAVIYKDASNNVWTSKDTSPNPQDVAFTSFVQESDATGDYMKFNCNFNCYVYRQVQTTPTVLWDSLKIQNAQFRGWFKR